MRAMMLSPRAFGRGGGGPFGRAGRLELLIRGTAGPD